LGIAFWSLLYYIIKNNKKTSSWNEKEKHLNDDCIVQNATTLLNFAILIFHLQHICRLTVSATWKQTDKLSACALNGITFLCAFAFNFVRQSTARAKRMHGRAIEWLTNIVIIYGASGTAVHDAWSNTRGICAQAAWRAPRETPSGAIRLLLIVDAPTWRKPFSLCFPINLWISARLLYHNIINGLV